MSKWFDRKLIPSDMLIDGNSHFRKSVAPALLKPGLAVYDVGGGKIPFIDVKEKKRLGLRVIGIDIDSNELSKAPQGAYDSTICADIAKVHGDSDGDLVICQAVLEHVVDTESAIKAISSLLNENGKAAIFVPSRNAVFAQLNIALPQKVKEKILFSIFPQTKVGYGFPSYYNNCTPRDLKRLAARYGLEVEKEHYYFISCRVPDEYLLKSKKPLMVGRAALEAILAQWKQHHGEPTC